MADYYRDFNVSPYPTGNRTKFSREAGGYVDASRCERDKQKTQLRNVDSANRQKLIDDKCRKTIGSDYDENLRF